MKRSSLYGLLNFYREYLPTFSELTEPPRCLLGQDARPWTEEAEAAVRIVAQMIVTTPKWMNMDPEEELRLETRVVKDGIAVLALQHHPEHRTKWLPVASWGRCLDATEVEDSQTLLEAKALREGSWKLSEYTAFARNLSMVVSKPLRALLKVAPKAHPSLQAMLIDLLHYRPKFLVNERTVTPP